jgi:sugar transferase (PEP-CTERM/EpsH1 system associated)
VPYPLEKGDKLRGFHQLRILQQHYRVCLITITTEPLHPEAKKHLTPLCEELHVFPISKASIGWNILHSFFNGKPFQVGYFFNSDVKEKVQAIISRFKPDVLYGQLLRTAEYIIDTPNTKRVLDLQDTFSKGIERRHERAFGPMRLVFKMEFNRLVKYERHVVNSFDHCTIISEQDRQDLPVSDKSKVSIVRNGVDMEYFAPQESEKSTDVLFAGNMGYPPNVVACEFLARDVLPILQQSNPKIRITLAGATPTPTVKNLASDNVEVTGWVDDMRNPYARTHLFVAPMMIGTGLQNKLLEAMSMGIPCITSALANNALGATPNEHLIIAKSPLEFADAINNLLSNPDQVQQIGKAGRKFIQENYGWEGQTEPLLKILSI